MRNIHGEDYWVDRLFITSAAFHKDENEYIIIDDVRYPNEAEAILRRGGILFLLKASEEDRIDRGGDLSSLDHKSEKALLMTEAIYKDSFLSILHTDIVEPKATTLAILNAINQTWGEY